MSASPTPEGIFPGPTSIDHEVQAALSLARASTAALLSLSALARREIIAALSGEVARLRTLDGEASLYAAEVLARYLPGLPKSEDL